MSDTPKPLGWYIKTPTDAELAQFGGCECSAGKTRCDCMGVNLHQGRPSPTAWRICDAIVCSIGFGLLMWVIGAAVGH